MDPQPQQPQFETWGIVEVMGHLKLAGKISEITIAGAGFVRIDVPQAEGAGFNTRIFGTGSIYSISPTDEATARALARRYAPAPVQPYELLPPGTSKPAAVWEDEDVDDGQERLPF